MLNELTIVLPLHNKAHAIEKTIKEISKSKLYKICQIIVVENESTDHSLKKIYEIQKIYGSKLDINIYTSKKGKGNAIRTAIPKIKYEWCWITGAELPFGFTDLEGAINDKLNSDAYLGSKSHPNSSINRKKSRELFSTIFYSLRKVLLNLNFRDTHGSIIVKSDKLKSISNFLTQESFFIDTEIVLKLYELDLNIIEVPISLVNEDYHSTVKPIKDGFKILYQTIKTSFKN